MYFGVLSVVSGINCLVSLATALLVIRRICFPHHARLLSVSWSEVAVAVVVPCYLPNEQGIIESTIEHILTQLVHEGPLTLHLVYNTPPGYAQQEKRLHALMERSFAAGRSLRVIRAAGSTSKAENLNLVVSKLDDPFVALYDADHHPDPLSLQLLLQTLLGSDKDAVQGSTYIRNRNGCGPSSWLARYLDAEFFVTHHVYFPAMEVLSQVGYFGGSNALWRTAVLKQYQFDKTMHTEDVDLSARAILDNFQITFCPAAASGELSPAGLHSLVQQRLRWFIGWEQVTHKYYWRVFFSPLTRLRKLGFCYMFHLRWLLLLAALLAAVINPIITSPFIYPLPTWSVSIQTCVYVTLVFYGFIAIYGFATALCPERIHDQRLPPRHRLLTSPNDVVVPHELARSRAGAALWVLLFFVFSGVYVIVHFTLQTVAFFKVFRGKVGEWTVTQRTGNPMPSGSRLAQLADPLLA